MSTACTAGVRRCCDGRRAAVDTKQPTFCVTCRSALCAGALGGLDACCWERRLRTFCLPDAAHAWQHLAFQGASTQMSPQSQLLDRNAKRCAWAVPMLPRFDDFRTGRDLRDLSTCHNTHSSVPLCPSFPSSPARMYNIWRSSPGAWCFWCNRQPSTNALQTERNHNLKTTPCLPACAVPFPLARCPCPSLPYHSATAQPQMGCNMAAGCQLHLSFAVPA